MMGPPSQRRPRPLVSPLLADRPGLVHGMFTREGGVSRPPFDHLNVGLSCGDDPSAVRENRQRVNRYLGLNHSVYINQIHGGDIAVIRQGRSLPGPHHSRYHVRAKDPLTPAKITIVPGTGGPPARLTAGRLSDPAAAGAGVSPPMITADGMITDIPDLLLVIQVADCQGVILFDPVRRVVGALHSGWRSSVANIIGKGVSTMAAFFGCRPLDIRAAVSPSLGPCCAEFIHFRRELPETFNTYHVGRSRFDFRALSRDQLRAEGVLPDNIHTAGYCTRCDPQRFFSYRREKITGRMAVAIGLRPGAETDIPAAVIPAANGRDRQGLEGEAPAGPADSRSPDGEGPLS